MSKTSCAHTCRHTVTFARTHADIITSLHANTHAYYCLCMYKCRHNIYGDKGAQLNKPQMAPANTRLFSNDDSVEVRGYTAPAVVALVLLFKTKDHI